MGQQDKHTHWGLRLASLLTALALSACGGGSGGDDATAQAEPQLLPQSASDVVATDAEAARFLTQATYGPHTEAIDELKQIGYSNWLNRQFASTSIDRHVDYVNRMGPPGCTVCDSQYINATMESFWLQALTGPDQLRQRMVLALSEIFVVSTVNSAVSDPVAHAAYLDMLADHAFGNFRDLLEAVTRHPTMGHYLSHIRNQKEDTNPKSSTFGRTPDENFAREVMQLFTIGLWEIDEYGRRVKDSAGQDIPTYGLDDVMGMARVMTGLSWYDPANKFGNWWGGTAKTWTQPMQMYPKYHSTGEKVFLKSRIAATTGEMTQAMADAELDVALDALFKHRNVPAFFGRQLIKRLVTSNPSEAYVHRVALAFIDNGQGVRGDMKAVIRAVLMDPEARDAAKIADPRWGKLREPMIRYANYLRAFHTRSGTSQFRIWNLEDPVYSLGQNPLRSPSVFNWYAPEYSPGGEMPADMSAPEFQITHETTLTGYTNFMADKVQRTTSRFTNDKPDAMVSDYSAEIALANDPDKLLDRLDILLMNGQMSSGTRQIVKDALKLITAKVWVHPAEEVRVHMAIRLLMASPEYLVQK